MNKLLRLLGFKSTLEKIDMLKSIDSDIENLELEQNSLITDYNTRNEGVKAMIEKGFDAEIVKSVQDRHEIFTSNYINELFITKQDREALLKKRENILKSDGVQEYYEYHKIKKAYKDGILKADGFDTFYKAKNGKVKYADSIVFNEDGKILLLQREKSDSSQPAKWVVPGGHVDHGESFEEAAKRELQEESGLIVKEVKKIGSYKDKGVHIEYYRSEVNTGEQPVVLQSDEAQDYVWISLNDLDKYDFPFNMKENLKQVLNIIPEEETNISKSEDLEFLYNELQSELTRLEDEFEKSKDFNIGVDILKAAKDISKLTKVQRLVSKNGKTYISTYYVKTDKEKEEKASLDKLPKWFDVFKDLKTGDKVSFTHKKKGTKEGIIKGYSINEKFGYLTVSVIDDEGNIDYLNTKQLSAVEPTQSIKKDIGLPEEDEYTLDGGYKVVKSLGGSTGAKLVEDYSGNKFVRKEGKDLAHISREREALKIYEHLGVSVPDVESFDPINGVMLTGFIENGEPLNPNDDFQKSLVKENFWADAFLANWDSIGLSYDNVLFDEFGFPYRVDVGGSLDKRAQGEPKEFKSQCTEFESMSDPNINPTAAKIFDFDEEGLIEQKKKLLDAWEKSKNDIIADPEISQKIKTILAERAESVRIQVKKYEKAQGEKSKKPLIERINYEGDLYDVKGKGLGENIEKFYEQVNKDFKINEKDVAFIESYYSTEQAAFDHTLSAVGGGSKGAAANWIDHAKEMGLTGYEVAAITDYTGSGYKGINDFAVEYTNSLNGNINFDKQNFVGDVKNIVNVPIKSYYDRLVTFAKSVNYHIEQGSSPTSNKVKEKNFSSGLAEISAIYGNMLKEPEKYKKEAVTMTKTLLGKYVKLQKHIMNHDGVKFPIIKVPKAANKYVETSSEDSKQTVGDSTDIKFKEVDFDSLPTYKKQAISRLKLVVNGLSKMAKSTNREYTKIGTFKRGITVSNKDLFKMQHEVPGQKVVHQWGSSSAYKANGFSGNHKLTIEGKGTYVDAISNYKGEKEVLHKPFTLFETVSYDANNYSKTMVKLKKIL